MQICVWMQTCVCMNMMQGDDKLCHSEKCFLSLMSVTKRNDERPVNDDRRKHLFHYMSTYKRISFVSL